MALGRSLVGATLGFAGASLWNQFGVSQQQQQQAFGNDLSRTTKHGGNDGGVFPSTTHAYTPLLSIKTAPGSAEPKSRRERAFSSQYKDYSLAEIIPIANDTALFRFLLPNAEDTFNLRPCSTLQCLVQEGSQSIEEIRRYYTPVTPNGTQGYFDIIVKRKNNGRMSGHFFGLSIGDKMRFRCQTFKMIYRANEFEEYGLIAGGTGFTPILQIIRHSLDEGILDSKGRPDKTKMSLICANRTEKHILLKGLFEDMAQRHPDRFKLSFVIDNFSDEATREQIETWQNSKRHYVGLVTPEMCIECLPRPNGNKNKIVVCGPDGLLSHVCGTSANVMDQLSSGKNVQPMSLDQNNQTPLGGVLKSLGWESHQVYRF